MMSNRWSINDEIIIVYRVSMFYGEKINIFNWFKNLYLVFSSYRNGGLLDLFIFAEKVTWRISWENSYVYLAMKKNLLCFVTNKQWKSVNNKLKLNVFCLKLSCSNANNRTICANSKKYVLKLINISIIKYSSYVLKDYARLKQTKAIN